MLPIADAIRVILDNITPLDVESVPLAKALGRILAEDIVADSDLRPFDRAQMDGYAMRAADVAGVPARLRIVGESAAGAPLQERGRGCESRRLRYLSFNDRLLFHLVSISLRRH
jgi:molybdopterin biosynthesis enzyme